MNSYRIFFLDSAGRTAGRNDLDSRDDAEAIAQTTRAYPNIRLEVWCGARMILRLDGVPAAPVFPLKTCGQGGVTSKDAKLQYCFTEF